MTNKLSSAKSQIQVLKNWLDTQVHPNLLADNWEQAAFKRALIRSFKRGVKFAKTGK